MSPLPGGSITLIPCDMRVAVAMWPLNELLYISITLLILLYSIVRTVHMNNSGDRANVFGPLQLFQLADIFYWVLWRYYSACPDLLTGLKVRKRNMDEIGKTGVEQ